MKMPILRFTLGEKVTFSLYQKLSDAKVCLKCVCSRGTAPGPVGEAHDASLVGWGGINPHWHTVYLHYVVYKIFASLARFSGASDSVFSDVVRLINCYIIIIIIINTI